MNYRAEQTPLADLILAESYRLRMAGVIEAARRAKRPATALAAVTSRADAPKGQGGRCTALHGPCDSSSQTSQNTILAGEGRTR
jgi:hypothetical protein